MVLPTFILLLLLILYPLIYSFWASLHKVDYTGSWQFVGLHNYVNVWKDPFFRGSLLTTLSFSAMSVIGGVLLGLIMALILNEQIFGRGFLRSIILIPWAMAPVVVGILWLWILDGQFGTLNAILYRLGLIDKFIPWMSDGWRALIFVALAYVWRTAPFAAVLFLATLQAIPPNLYNVAKVDGANAFFRFRHITLPWLKPTLFLVVVLLSIDAILQLDLIFVMTRGGPGHSTSVIAWVGYKTIYTFSKYGQGSAILYLLTLICLVLAMIYIWLLWRRNQPSDHMVIEAASAVAIRFADQRGQKHVDGGLNRPKFEKPRVSSGLLGANLKKRLAQLMLNGASLTILMWVMLPFLWLIILSVSRTVDLLDVTRQIIPFPPRLDNYYMIFMPERVAATGVGGGYLASQAAKVIGSLAFSSSVALIVTLISLFFGSLAGYAYARYERFKFMRTTLLILLATRMIPTLVLILPFFLLFNRLGILGGQFPLIITYLALILPLTIWILKGYFETIPVSLERAAMVDGCNRIQSLVRVVIPLSLPGLIAAGIFAIMTTWNEFMYGLILGQAPTIPVTIAFFMEWVRQSPDGYGILFASGVLGCLPPILLALLVQKYLIQGMTAGATKG